VLDAVVEASAGRKGRSLLEVGAVDSRLLYAAAGPIGILVRGAMMNFGKPW
jgi:hypothetical protein